MGIRKVTFPAKLLKFTIEWGGNLLLKIRNVMISLAVIGLGILLGSLSNSSRETVELTLSIIIVVFLMLLIMQRPLNGVLLWMFFMAFLEQWVEIPMGAGIPDLSFSRFIIAFLAIFLVANAAIDEFRFAPLSLADICIAATTIGVMTSAPLADNPKRAIQLAISVHFAPLVIYFFAKNLVKSKKDLHQLLFVIAFFGFVAGAYAAYEHATGNILFISKSKPDEVFRLYRGETGIRLIVGLLGGSGTMGRALAVTIPVTFYLLLAGAKTQVQKILLAGMIVVQCYGIVVAMSRTPWYALLLALLVMQFFYPQFRKVFITIVCVAIIVLWVTWDQVSDSDVGMRINDRAEGFNGRDELWETGTAMWRARPVRGWGVDGFAKESGHFRTDGRRENFHSVHNDYLDILISAGLIGFLPYLLFIVAPLINSLRLFFRARAPDWSGFIKPETIAVYWAVMICLLVTSYTATINNPVIKVLPIAVAGAIVGSHESFLRASKTKTRSSRLSPTTAVTEGI